MGEDVSMSAPVNQSLHLAGNTLSVEGITDTSENAYIEVRSSLSSFTMTAIAPNSPTGLAPMGRLRIGTLTSSSMMIGSMQMRPTR